MVSGQCPEPRHQIELFYLENNWKVTIAWFIEDGKGHAHKHKASAYVLLA
jgi:hypothetical protein